MAQIERKREIVALSKCDAVTSEEAVRKAAELQKARGKSRFCFRRFLGPAFVTRS